MKNATFGYYLNMIFTIKVVLQGTVWYTNYLPTTPMYSKIIPLISFRTVLRNYASFIFGHGLVITIHFIWSIILILHIYYIYHLS